MSFARLRQHRQPWALALALALLWLTGWGQVHRVVHVGHAVPVYSVPADGQAGKALWSGHEDGRSLCQLLDHLSQGAAPLALVTLLLALDVPPLRAVWTPCWRHVFAFAPFEARGPPPLP